VPAVRRLAATLATTLTLASLAHARAEDPRIALASQAASVGGSDGPAARPAEKPAARTAGDEIPVSGNQAGSVEEQRTAARTKLTERLNVLASWCNDKELFLERDRVWRKILEIAPDDPGARKGLRYARNVDGSWKDPAPREAKNRNLEALADLHAREEGVYAPYGDGLLALARAADRSAAERDALVAEIRAIAPNHAGLHEWLGDVQMGDRWVMPETATAKARRGAIRAEAKRVMEAGAAIATAAPEVEESALGVTWKTVLQGENVRVLSTGPEEEALRIARACEGAGALLGFALGTEVRYPGAYTLYVLTQPGEKEVFLAQLPGLADDERARLSALEGTGIPRSNNVALFGQDPARRVDAAVRHTIGNILGISLGVSHKTAWAWEGLGQYLTRELVGTRLTWFVSEAADPTTAGLRGKLMTPESNWFQEAFDLLSTGTAVPLEDLLRRDLDAFDVPGALTGYVWIAYLLEGQPEATLEFVTRSAKGEDPAVIAREVLKRTPSELQERLMQWLSERR